ncbi:hypothetical protein Naga_101668g1 [Nannochloropsis gaditana]|uniref:Uncharacterized protein n=1 Tax=Nannochloropsis gaditana TaxID=72520 RepID=W7TAC0_9STRA|nr:hypothetical protein Naga_101668g1 [Nannochloropsis gaditana]
MLGPTRLKHRVLSSLCEGDDRMWEAFVSISCAEWEEAGKEGEGEGGAEEGRKRLVFRKLREQGVDPRIYFASCEEKFDAGVTGEESECKRK